MSPTKPRDNQLSFAQSPETQRQIDEIVAATGHKKAQIVRDAIALYHQQVCVEPGLIIGYIQVDRPGDIDTTGHCPECSQPFGPGGLWMAAHQDGHLSGPVCTRCATSE